MGGKSRKSGGVSKRLIETLKQQANSPGGKKGCGPKKSNIDYGKGLFDPDEPVETKRTDR